MGDDDIPDIPSPLVDWISLDKFTITGAGRPGLRKIYFYWARTLKLSAVNQTCHNMTIWNAKVKMEYLRNYDNARNINVIYFIISPIIYLIFLLLCYFIYYF